MTPFGPPLAWFETLRHGVGIVGALIGLLICQIYFWLEGYPEDYGVNYFVAAFLGSFWWIYVFIGWANGYRRSIIGWAVALGSFMALATPPDPDFTPFLGAVGGLGLGSLFGSGLPLLWHRLLARLQSRGAERKFVLALDAAFQDEEDRSQNLVIAGYPFEATLELMERYGVSTREELLETVDEAGKNDDLGAMVAMVRWGVSCYLIDRQEAWKLLASVPERARSLYGSWEEYAADQPDGDKLTWLLQDRKSPWKRIPWS